MLYWLRCMSHPDGTLGAFNDSAGGVAPSIEELERYAAEFGIHRVTVSRHLRRTGVAVRGSRLGERESHEAAALYAAGWSAARVAERLGVCADTVLRSLREPAQ